MVELCIFKGSVFRSFLDIYLYFSELKIPEVFLSSTAKKVEILSESSTNSDEILTFNNLYLRIGYVYSSQERIKSITYNYFKKKMLGNLSHAVATELLYDIPRTPYSFPFQRIQIPDELVGSILKLHIEQLYSLDMSEYTSVYKKSVHRCEEIFKLNDIW